MEVKVALEIGNEIKEIPEELLNIILKGEDQEQDVENRQAIINAIVEGIIEDGTMKNMLLKEMQLRIDLHAAEYDIEATTAIVGS